MSQEIPWKYNQFEMYVNKIFRQTSFIMSTHIITAKVLLFEVCNNACITKCDHVSAHHGHHQGYTCIT
jgi:hypothetical protein